MKYITLFLILIICGLVGLCVKNKYKKQKEMLEFLSVFLDYLYLNISLYKNNINEIINNYKIQQNNKNAKFVKLFQNSNNLRLIDEDFLKLYIYNKEYLVSIKLFFDTLGTGIKDDECEKIKQLNSLLKSYILKTNDDIKNRGDLSFKIILAIGVVIDIVLW